MNTTGLGSQVFMVSAWSSVSTLFSLFDWWSIASVWLVLFCPWELMSCSKNRVLSLFSLSDSFWEKVFRRKISVVSYISSGSWIFSGILSPCFFSWTCVECGRWVLVMMSCVTLAGEIMQNKMKMIMADCRSLSSKHASTQLVNKS